MNIIRQRITARGGGIEVSLDEYGYEGEFMSAYQNYLGGGMLGSIHNSCTITDWFGNPELTRLAEQMRQEFSELMGHESYDQFDGLPISAY